VQNELALHELFRAVPLGFKQRKLPFGYNENFKGIASRLGSDVIAGSLFLQIALAQTPPLPSPWAPMGRPMRPWLSLRRDPFDPGVLFVGTFFGGLYKSVDRGATWSHVNSPFTSTSVFSIAADPHASRNLLRWYLRQRGISDHGWRDQLGCEKPRAHGSHRARGGSQPI